MWCFQVVRPFVQPFLWGVILAIAVHPIYVRLGRGLGDRRRITAAVLVGVILAALIVPSVLLTTSLVKSATRLAGDLHQGAVRIPPPPASVADWPVVGDTVYRFWATASKSLEAALGEVAPHLRPVGEWIVSAVASTGIGLAMFVFSIVIAGALLANGARATEVARGIARRLVHERGDELLELTRATVQSVTRGILGVALIQAVAAGLGMLAVGVPGAGLWALLILLMAVIQLTPALVLLPVVVYVFSASPTWVAVLFAIWSLAVGLSDNVLKPLLLGRGVDVPMLVIFMGAIGGFVLNGVIGLFVGAVVLALGYTLFRAWLEELPSAAQAPVGDG